MPILAIHPLSQFTLDGTWDVAGAAPGLSGPALSGTATYRSGLPVDLLLNEEGPTGLALDQATEIDGTRFRPGARLTSAGTARFGQVDSAIIALEGRPVGLVAGDTAFHENALLHVESAPPGAGAFTLPQTQPHRGIICFATGTQISTTSGPRRVETLRPGERVLTADQGTQPVIWTGRREILFKRHDNRYRPILIRAGALGPNCPARDLIVSPEHRMLLTGATVEDFCGSSEVLAPAGALIGLPGIRPMHGKRRVTYVHVMLPSHDILDAEGAGSESFYPDTRALAALGDSQRQALFQAVPALRETPWSMTAMPARPLLDHHHAAALALRMQSDDAIRYSAPPAIQAVG